MQVNCISPTSREILGLWFSHRSAAASAGNVRVSAAAGQSFKDIGLKFYRCLDIGPMRTVTLDLKHFLNRKNSMATIIKRR